MHSKYSRRIYRLVFTKSYRSMFSKTRIYLFQLKRDFQLIHKPQKCVDKQGFETAIESICNSNSCCLFISTIESEEFKSFIQRVDIQPETMDHLRRVQRSIYLTKSKHALLRFIKIFSLSSLCSYGYQQKRRRIVKRQQAYKPNKL